MRLSISMKIKYRAQFKKLLNPYMAKLLSGNFSPTRIPDSYFTEARSCLKNAWECLENNAIDKRYENEEVIKESLKKFESLIDEFKDCYNDGDKEYFESYSREIHVSLHQINNYISERWSVKGGQEEEQFYDGIDIKLIDDIENAVELAIADIASNYEISELQVKQFKGYIISNAKRASLNSPWLGLGRSGRISKSIDEAKQRILDRIDVVNEKRKGATCAEGKLEKCLNDCSSSFTKLNKQIEELQKIDGDATYFADKIKKLENDLESVRSCLAKTTKPYYAIIVNSNLIAEIDELTKSVEKYEDEVEKSTAFCLDINKHIIELNSEIAEAIQKRMKEEQERCEDAKFDFEEQREEIRNNIEELETQIQLNHERLNSKKDSMQKHVNVVITQAHKSTMETFESVPKDIATIITTLGDEMNKLYNATSTLLAGSLGVVRSFSFIWEKETNDNVMYDNIYSDGAQVILKWESQYEELKSYNNSLAEALMSCDALCKKADDVSRESQKQIVVERKSISERQQQLTKERNAVVKNIDKAVKELKKIESNIVKIRSSIKKPVNTFTEARMDSLADSHLLQNCEKLISRYVEENKRVEVVNLDYRCPVFSWESPKTTTQQYTRNTVKAEEMKIDECDSILQKYKTSVQTMTAMKNLLNDISVQLERETLILLSDLHEKRQKHEEEEAKIADLKSTIEKIKCAIDALFREIKTSAKKAKSKLDKCSMALEGIGDTSRFEQPNKIEKYRIDVNEKIEVLFEKDETINNMRIDYETKGFPSTTLATKLEALENSFRTVADINESVNHLTAETENLYLQINMYQSEESSMLKTDRTTKLTIVRDTTTRNTIGFFPCGSSKIKTVNGLISVTQKAVLMLNEMRFNSAGTVLGISGQDGIDGNLAFPDDTGVRFFLADAPCLTANTDFTIKVNNRTESVFVGSKYEFKRIDGTTVYTLTTANTPENTSVTVNFVLSKG